MTDAAAVQGADELKLDQWQQAVCALPATASAMVVGGPGTGKTTALVERAAALLDGSLPGTDDWRPDHLLVLTANRHTATELRDRLALRLGRPSSGPIARTVASVAFSLVQSQLDAPVTLLTGAEHDTLIAELLEGEVADGADGCWPAALSRELRTLRGFRGELREFVMRAEEFGFGPDQLGVLGDQHHRPEWTAVGRFLRGYAGPKAGAHPNQFDAAELVAYAARVLTEADGATLGLLGQVRVVFVDDAQEANESTISLLRAFASRGIAIMAYGDPDVAGNGFRGGRADLIGGFDRLLGVSAHRLLLQHRYRGTHRLRGEYARVIEAIGTRGVSGHREVIERASGVHADDECWSHLLSASPYTEARAIAEQLRQQHLLDGVPWQQMAVVARSSGAALAIETALARFGVPTRRSATKVLLRDDAAARWLLDAAQFAYEAADGQQADAAQFTERVLGLLTGALGCFDAIELRRLRLALRTAEVQLDEAFAQPAQFELVRNRLADRAAAVARTLEAAAVAARTGSLEEVLWTLWSRSPALALWTRQAAGHGALAEEANAALDAVVAVFAAARRFVERRPTERGTVFLEEQFTAAVPEDLLTQTRSGQTVTVTTPSQLVGRSFHTVVVAELIDGVWPNLRPRFSLLHADQLAAVAHAESALDDASAARAEVRSDEYRLFALAISRATHRVVLSSYAGEEARPSVLFGATEGMTPTTRKPSQLRDLAAELRRELVRSTAAERPHRQAAAALAQLARNGVAGADPTDWYGLREWSTNAPLYEADVVEGRLRVSPSAIEKLEKSPLAWFVDAFAPGSSSTAQSTGVIVHSALEQLGGDPSHSTDDYLDIVLPKLAEVPVEAEWMREPAERRVRAMIERLRQYLDTAAAAGRTLAAAEVQFVLQRDGVTVSGVIDRVERSASGEYYVVDLKTGKTVPSKAEGQASAQLECYQLAIREGGVIGIEATEDLQGAALLYVNTSNLTPTLLEQPALTAETGQQVWQRISAAAQAMQGPHFTDFPEVDDRGPSAARRYRIQMIPAVSAP